MTFTGINQDLIFIIFSFKFQSYRALGIKSQCLKEKANTKAKIIAGKNIIRKE